MRTRLSILTSACVAACAMMACAMMAGTSYAVPAPGKAPDKALVWQPLYEPGGGGAMTAVAVSPHDPQHLISLGDMLGVGTSFDGGDSWQATFGFMAYEFSGGITFHPTDRDTVWIASASGPYKSTDRGIHWVSKRTGMPQPSAGRYTAIVEKVLFDPDQPDRLLSFGGTSRNWNEADTFGWIWESLDSGENWRHIGTITDAGFTTEAKKGANIHAVQYEPGSSSRLHLRTGAGHWFISDDAGRTWRQHQPQGLPTKPSSITFHPKNPNLVWVTTGSYLAGEGDATRQPGGIFKSSDGGKTFVASDSGINKVNARSQGSLSSNFNNIVVSPANPDILFTNDGAWNASIIYKSTDGGANWFPVAAREGIGVENKAGSQKVFNPKTATFAGISMKGVHDPQSAERNYWYNTEFILRTRDGGKTWDDATAYQPDLQNKPDSWRGRGWVGWCSTNFAWNPYRRGQAIAQAMDAGRAWISDDDAQSWRYLHGSSHPWLGGKDVTFTQDGHIYVSTGQFGENNGLWRSRDWGKTWTLLAGEKRGLPDAGWGKRPEYEGITAHPAKSDLVWVVLGDRLLHSSDAGEAWRAVENAPAGARFLAADPTRAGRFYVAARRGVFVTEDGQSFTDIGGPRPAGRGRINCDSQGRVLICQWREGRSGVWRYTPANKTWQRLLDENLAFECVADPNDPQRLLMVTNMDPFNDLASGNGVWISADDGKSWSRQDSGLAMLRGQAVAFNPHNPEQIVMGTFGRGFFQTRWPRNLAPAGTRTYLSTAEDTRAAEPTPVVTTAVTVRNGDMSAGTAVPDHWGGKFGDVTAARDTTTFKSAPAALRVDGQAGKSGQAFQQFEFGAGKTYTVTGWVKAEGDAKVNFAVQSFAGDWSKNDFNQVGFLQGTIDWTRFSKNVTIPAWAGRFNVVLMVEGKGRGWLDDVRVTEVQVAPKVAVTTPVKLVNADFSAGTTVPEGWTEKWGEVTAARDTQTFKSAPAALRVEGQAGKRGQAFQMWDVPGGGTYLVSGWVKTQGDAKVNVAVQSFAGDWSKNNFDQLKYVQGTSDWQQFSKEVKIPDWAGRFNLQLMVEGAGQAWLDDVKVEPQGAAATTGTPATSAATTTPSASPTAPAVAVAATEVAATDAKPFPLLVKNGAMTQGLGVPQDWRDKEGAVDVALDKEVFKEGPSSLRVTVSGGKGGSVRQTIRGGAGGQFRLSAWVKSQGNVKGQLAVQAFAEGWKNNKFIQLQYFQGDNAWMKIEKDVVLPEWTAFFYVALLAEGDGKVWLDEVGAAGQPVDQGKVQTLEEIMTTQPPAKDKPGVAGWGFYPQFPGAWMSFHKSLLERTKQGREKKDINVMFFGDSITQAWDDPKGGKEVWDKHFAPLGAANYGRGGDSTRQVLWRIQNGEVEGLNPKLVVLKVGTNNFYEDFNAGSDEEIAAGIKAIVQELRTRLPNPKVLLLGILPRQNEWFSGRARRINAIIKNLDDGQNVRFLDMSDQFQTALGKVKPELYSGDQLHLAKPGYEVWAQTMKPLFDEMLK